MSYTPEQVAAIARELQSGDAQHYTADAAHMLEDYAATLRQPSADSGRVGDEVERSLLQEARDQIHSLAGGFVRADQLIQRIDAALAAQGQAVAPFIVGNAYRTKEGELVRFVSVHNEGTDYETMADESGVHRYTRRDFGRVTGTAHDYSDPRNTPPLYTHPAPAASPAELAAAYTRGRSDGWEAARATSPAGVPDGWVSMPREALMYVSDLLAERKYGALARSPAHNARIVVDYWLTAAPSAPIENAGVPDGAVLYANVHAFNGKNDGCVTVRKRDEFFTVPLYTRPIQESGWLIEAWDRKRNELKAEWWSITHDGSCDEHWAWSSDSTSALRFARECDAQAYIEDMGWTEAKPTEHEWVAAAPSAPEGDGGAG